MSTSKPISKFKGIDVRRLRENSDPRTARIATNVDLTVGQEFKARDGLRLLMPLDPHSKGLYTLGHTLRSVMPGGHGFPQQAVGPVLVRYDHVGFGNTTIASILIRTKYSDVVSLEGAAWPSAMPGRTLTIDGVGHTVLSVSGLDVTLADVLTLPPGLHAFTLSGLPALAARYVNMVNTTSEATLVGDVWPDTVEGTLLTLTQNGYAGRVISRVSDTVVRMDTARTGGDISEGAYQLAGLADDYPLDTLIRVASAVGAGASASFGVYPYLVLERWVDAGDHAAGTAFEHHWITTTTPDEDIAPTTQVILPFAPGASLVSTGGKLWASDDINGVVRFSSTLNGPRDWVTPQDAGYLSVLAHAAGDRTMQALGIYDDKLAVIFSDSVQLWATDPQPSNITLVRALNGPGTDQENSVVNVLGDLFYFTRGGFRSLHTQTVTGQIQENDDIGAPIDELSAQETGQASVALWSQSRGQYLCAFGSRVYAFRYSPMSKVMGWTTWELGATVDAMVELNGVMYIRSGDNLYDLKAGYLDGSTWEVVMNGFSDGSSSQIRFDFVEVAQRGTCEIGYYLEPDRDDFYLAGPTLVGTTMAIDRVYVGTIARVLSTRFTGQGPWTLSSFQFQFNPLAW